MQSFDKTFSTLQLENGLEFQGFLFGYTAPAEGEVVFSTIMSGYPEALTDPSYSGQILCITYPLIGNYGVPAIDDKIHIRGLIVTDYSFDYSHWRAVKSLDQWLKEQKIPAIYGVDTRQITKVLRDSGSMLGRIMPNGKEMPWDVDNPQSENLVDVVSCKEVSHYGSSKKRVVLLDCGVRPGVIEAFTQRGIEVIRVPWNYDFNDGSIGQYNGLLISNGPGDPDQCDNAVKNIKRAMELNKPIYGLCLGNALLAKAAGGRTYKLKCGHHSANQPVSMYSSKRCYITSQVHDYAVDFSTLNSAEWDEYFTNMNDGTCEGIIHKTKPFFGTHFYPEFNGNPDDTAFLFDKFISML